jgi:hypothetical protein
MRSPDAVRGDPRPAPCHHRKLCAPYQPGAAARQSPLSEANVDQLIQYLKGRVNVQYDKYVDTEGLSPSAAVAGPKDAHLSTIAEEEEMAYTAADKEKGD